MDSPKPFMPIPKPSVLPMNQDIERAQRAAVIAEALTWVGTPYAQLGNHKGFNIDCSMLLVRCWVDAGIFEPFDPRPYPPEWHLHRSEERYLEWMAALAEEVDVPVPGDIILYQFGRCFSHGGIYIGDDIIVHAYVYEGQCTRGNINSSLLWYLRDGVTPRPKKYFNVWKRLYKLQEAM